MKKEADKRIQSTYTVYALDNIEINNGVIDDLRPSAQGHCLPGTA